MSKKSSSRKKGGRERVRSTRSRTSTKRGMGGMDRRTQKMMANMDVEELNGVEEVIIRFSDKDLVITSPQVTKMNMGVEAYQVLGTATEKMRGESSEEVLIDDSKVNTISIDDIPKADIEFVISQTNVTKEEAISALIKSNGDLAGALMTLKQHEAAD
ncbi:MAG: nascent polypeptide-associated complex protein [Candidatus Kariarchaeaceae archaeon]